MKIISPQVTNRIIGPGDFKAYRRQIRLGQGVPYDYSTSTDIYPGPGLVHMGIADGIIRLNPIDKNGIDWTPVYQAMVTGDRFAIDTAWTTLVAPPAYTGQATFDLLHDGMALPADGPVVLHVARGVQP